MKWIMDSIFILTNGVYIWGFWSQSLAQPSSSLIGQAECCLCWLYRFTSEPLCHDAWPCGGSQLSGMPTRFVSSTMEELWRKAVMQLGSRCFVWCNHWLRLLFREHAHQGTTHCIAKWPLRKVGGSPTVFRLRFAECLLNRILVHMLVESDFGWFRVVFDFISGSDPLCCSGSASETNATKCAKVLSSGKERSTSDRDGHCTFH